jgi:alpha-beta hydrolase superfamily lysophospholipase
MSNTTNVATATGLNVTYELHPSPIEGGKPFMALLHGLSHTRAEFERLIRELGDRGIDTATVDIQSGTSMFRNFTAMDSYVSAAGETLRRIEEDTKRRIDVLCGHSMGGRELQLLQDGNANMRRPTALIAPVPFTGAMPATGRAWKRDKLKVAAMFATMDVTRAMRTDEDVRQLFFDEGTPQGIVTATRRNLRHTSFMAYAELGSAIKTPRPTGEDTLLIRSDTDELFRSEEYEREREHYGDRLQEVVFPRYGHDMFIEGAEETAKHLATFAWTKG